MFSRSTDLIWLLLIISVITSTQIAVVLFSLPKSSFHAHICYLISA